MKKYIFSFILVIALASITTLISRGFRIAEVPNGAVTSCNTCHTSGGGTPRNNFGLQVENFFLTNSGSSGHVKWNPLFASLDADNDGATNGEELQDPFGEWAIGMTNPGSTSDVTSPGNSSSSPFGELTINFSNMTPHVGQNFYLRIVDMNSNQEVKRTNVTVSESFSIKLDAVQKNHHYFVDFFADLNGNGLYDAPPTDHAWREEINSSTGNDVINFSHNTNFVNIDWPYNFNISFTNMNAHIGELFEIRIVDNSSMQEVGRDRIEFIPSANFSMNIPGIKGHKEYKVDMYADHNQNGKYDSPPDDHAWTFTFNSSTGDYKYTFDHNANFSSIDWKYQYQLNLLAMNPHIANLVEARVVRESDQMEIYRNSFELIDANTSIRFPGISMGEDYRVDFYADLNGNGEYDAPPNDHAWRMTFNSTTGNYVQNFSHNTNFTDIEWPKQTDLRENLENNLPNNFSLSQNYPNPFNPSTVINYNLDKPGFVTLSVYNVQGEMIHNLVNDYKNEGYYSIRFDAKNLSSGTYFYRITNGNNSITKKMILLR